MSNKINVGKLPFSEIYPHLKLIAKQNNLKINNVKHLLIAKEIYEKSLILN